MMKEEQILIRITGQDRPGLTAAVMGILAKYDALLSSFYLILNNLQNIV